MTAHVESAIERYFRGDIQKAEERDALFGHLDRCQVCRQSFEAQSEATRLLSGRSFARAELEAMLPAILDAAAPAPARGLAWLRWAAPLLAASAAGLLLMLQPPPNVDTARGGTHDGGAVVEALCFDERFVVTAHLKEAGGCPAPGFVKILYASPATVPALSVVILSESEVRLEAHVQKPEPRSVLADYAKLAPGETLRVIAISGPETTALEVAKRLTPVMTIHGDSR